VTGTIAITGGTGFVGGRVVAALLARGNAVRAFARDPSRVAPGAEAVAWEAATAPALGGVSAVVSCAAFVPDRYDDPSAAADCVAVNALAPLRVALAAAEAGARVVHVSTGNVYRPQDRPVHEDDPVDPVGRASTYLGAKALGDLWVRGVPDTAVLRPSAIYGPGMGRGVVRTFVERLTNGDPIRVANGGRHRADFVWVGDVVAAILAALDTSATGAFNVGSGTATSTRELAYAVAAALGRDRGHVVVEPEVPDTLPSFSALDVSRARAELGFVPTPLAVGLDAWLAEL
jgi:UDP-glucose 4-epimerase